MGAEQIRKRAVVAVIRGAKPETILPIASALEAGGVTALEITMETPKALKIIEKLCEEFGNKLLIGAGTVLDAYTAREAIMAGSQFVFSPSLKKETIEMAKRYGVISVPGAFTPTEILSAYEYGADLVKVFPANVGGPEYLKSLAGPLPHIPLMPTGGINLKNASEFIKAGAAAIGAGSTLVDPKNEMTDKYLEQICLNAKRFMQAVKSEPIFQEAPLT
ncbi:2-dehydro-3-deoxyphosphogluconate aldolase / (4S)-4-hydroxy-2-oxoglutarate aldolase [Bacillus sp. OV322]|uniref:bifunctional 4-hydroxy-2-oxoglutarate aldolase/2-dehydro-3-deoxy-phosphogluconate aldolase n=1 Tax=Bacillus sp. OV322 TaxID=1882764 RepID=UPI0008F03E84|nr:bifunctional 4-hydroxy-2-oxoglutarate aldolase/2-dehydro-3-deoxy-phosphogluconate aldolase [Bacillus sp. OV322]SFC66210.1 2-dehydro-3-deoxyphosphogluconate aldolase / (4S)-4-hydroxy-2-oxoglutarate aldolase [Bacillus sp. OV322]